MTRYLVLLLASGALSACGEPKAKECSRNADCPANATCVASVCQQRPASGGSSATVPGATRMTAGTLTMDATLGQPVTPAATAGTVKVTPAENTR